MLPTGQRGGDRGELLDLHDAAVRQQDPAAPKGAHGGRELGPDGGQIHGIGLIRELVQAGQRQRLDGGPLGHPAALQQLLEAGIAQRLDEDAEQEAVGERLQAGVVRERVGGADADAQGAVDHGVAAAEDPVVEQPQQRVQDGRGAKEYLVQEGQLGLRKHALGAGLDDAVAQLLEVDGAEDLRRLGEAAEQVLERGPAEGRGDASDSFGLGRSRGADHEQVLPRDGGEHDQLGQRLTLDEPCSARPEGAAYIFGHWIGPSVRGGGTR